MDHKKQSNRRLRLAITRAVRSAHRPRSFHGTGSPKHRPEILLRTRIWLIEDPSDTLPLRRRAITTDSSPESYPSKPKHLNPFQNAAGSFATAPRDANTVS